MKTPACRPLISSLNAGDAARKIALKKSQPVAQILLYFRGSENPVKCKKCHGDMDAMRAYCAERVGSYIVHHRDPRA
jgi:hypothetical protein